MRKGGLGACFQKWGGNCPPAPPFAYPSAKCTCMHTSVPTGKLYTVGFRSAVSDGSYTYATDMGYASK